MKKNKRLMIIVGCLLLIGSVSFAYFTSKISSSGTGEEVTATTVTINSSELKVEGTLEFADLDVYPGHQNVSSIKVTATGNNELIPYNLIWEGINTINTPINYIVYKSSSSIDTKASCTKKEEYRSGSKIYYEECEISNIDSLGEPISSGTIDKSEESKKYILTKDEFLTATSGGTSWYYYIVLEYPNLDENQNLDMGGTFNGEVTVEESDATPDINIVAAYIEQEDGTYEEVNDIPQSGYQLNTEKSVCSNGATPTGYTPNITINNLTKSGTECYLYFDEATAKDVILAGKTISSSRSSSITGILIGNENTDSNTIYTTEDDWGTSYFFAGLPNNNWVSFAGHYWRIIRINGDGSIRLIYSGTGSAQTSGTGTQITVEGANTFRYNQTYGDNTYVGYMYGTTGANSYSDAHANTNSSTIKGILDTWYQSNLASYADKISTEAGFCNDRKVYTGSSGSGYGTLGYGTNATTYEPTSRFMQWSSGSDSWKSTQNPTLKCSQSNDLFTVSSSSKGNKKLTNPIGLITADEVVFAGGFGGRSNSNYYLYTNSAYWTMSPYRFYGGGANVFFVYSNGYHLGGNSVSNVGGVRPVINLKADVRLTGDGTSSNPYVVSS